MGEVCIVPEGLECCIGQRQVLLRPKNEIDGRYLFYALRSSYVRHQIFWNEGTGSTVSNVRIPILEALKIPRLGSSEAAIGRLLGALDDKIDLNRHMNETLEAMARAIFKDWFVDFGPTRAKMEGCEPYLASDIWALFPDRLNEEAIPAGWKKKPLSAFFDIIGGGTPKTSVEEYWNGDIPWFSVVDTPNDGSAFVHETEKTITVCGLAESSARLIPPGTTIISARGTVGNLAIAAREMTFNQSCYGLRGRLPVGDCFVFLAAQHMVAQLQSLAHGSVFSTITRQTFDALTLSMPTSETLFCFSALVAPLFARQKANGAASRTLAQTRDLLLPKLMSGEILVKDAEKIAEEAL
jgi:type I restriction enzyme S subunit